MREGIFAGHYGNTIFCPTASCIYYCSFAKERPWAEHLSSLPKRVVGALSGVSILNYESPPMSCLQWLDASEATNWTIWSQVLTAHNTLNSTMSGIACNARHNYLHPSTQSCPCNNLWWRSFLSHMWTAFETVLLTTPWVCSISHVKLMGAHSSKLWPHTDTGNCVENRRWALFCETTYNIWPIHIAVVSHFMCHYRHTYVCVFKNLFLLLHWECIGNAALECINKDSQGF